MASHHATHFVYAKFWEPIQPIDRGDRYEDPLSEALERAALGEVTGGGSLLTASGEIKYAGIDLELVNLDSALELCRLVLEECGAPRGSEFLFTDGSEEKAISFGLAEGVAVYLDGTGLPPAVYRESDVNDLIRLLADALGNDGEFRHYWEGPNETALYLYGKEAERVVGLIQPVLLSYPLGQNARIVVRHGNPCSNLAHSEFPCEAAFREPNPAFRRTRANACR